jgi:hypothetical protein
LASIDSEFKDKDGIIYLKAVQARMQRYLTIFIFKSGGHVCLFLFCAQKTTLPLRKIGGKFSRAKKMLGLGAISFDKAF